MVCSESMGQSFITAWRNMAARITWMNVVLCIAIQYNDEQTACQGFRLSISRSFDGALLPPPHVWERKKVGTPHTPPRDGRPLEPCFQFLHIRCKVLYCAHLTR